MGVDALERYLRDTVGKELWRDDLEIGKQLGAGEFGAVHEGEAGLVILLGHS
jgi:hypothetical protein